LEVSKIGQHVASWAATKPTIRAVWLIGSRAKGTHRPDSDVDLAAAYIPAPDFTEFFYDRKNWTAELRALIPLEIHLLTCRRNRRQVWAGAKERRILLYWRAPAGLLGSHR
jgi:predicted nucleotidyltransferase